MANRLEALNIVRIGLSRDLARIIEPAGFQLLDIGNRGVKNKIHPIIFSVGSLHLHPCCLQVRCKVQVRSSELLGTVSLRHFSLI